MIEPRAHNSVIFFLVLTFVLSSIFYARSFSGAPLGQVAPLLMWMPGVAAIVTQLTFHRTIKGLGWRPGSFRYLAMAILIPIFYCLAIYVPVWLAGLGLFNGSRLGKMLPFLPIAMVQSLVTALGEEIGWRGFLAPAFYRTRGFLWAGIGTGLIWALWHVPLIVVGGYGAGTPVWYATACFLISVPGMSVVLAWLRLRSNSLWTAVLYHAVHNVAIQDVFDGSTIDTGATRWITTEFGFGLASVSVLFSIYFWSRRAELTSQAKATNVRSSDQTT
jgi:membrane protease YdiL (CAAX protease family)